MKGISGERNKHPPAGQVVYNNRTAKGNMYKSSLNEQILKHTLNNFGN